MSDYSVILKSHLGVIVQVTKTAQRCWKVTQGQGGKKSKLNETDELKPNESS